MSANSLYGFCGVREGAKYACMPVAATTTFCGRNMIAATLAYIERHYDGVSVIYGDTDSVMIQFPYDSPLLRGVPQERVMPTVFESARGMARATTAALFTPPISLEFEKVRRSRCVAAA